MEEFPFQPPQDLDLDRVKREAWIETYLTQALTAERMQQLEDYYFQSDEAALRVAEMLQLQVCLASRNRKDERRNNQSSGSSKSSRSRSSSRSASRSSRLLPVMILGAGVLVLLFFLGRTFFTATPTATALPAPETSPAAMEATQKGVPPLSASPQKVPADLTQMAQFRPPPFPIIRGTNWKADETEPIPEEEAFRKTMDRYLVTKDYCGAAVEFGAMPASASTEFYGAVSELLCGRKAVAIPKLRSIGRAGKSIYAEEALLLVAKSEIQSSNFALATRELTAARALDGHNQLEIARMLKLLGEK